MKWKIPHISKIYEALGTVSDNRIEVTGNSAKVFSSSGNKFYTINYSPEKKAIMCNDNSSYWKGSLGYPAIAFLMKVGVLEYDEYLGKLLKGIKWKDINVKFKNDFDKTIKHISSDFEEQDQKDLEKYVNKTMEKIEELNLGLLGKKQLPPEGY